MGKKENKQITITYESKADINTDVVITWQKIGQIELPIRVSVKIPFIGKRLIFDLTAESLAEFESLRDQYGRDTRI